MSEFGTLLVTCCGGYVVKTPEGSVVFVSRAFNPLTAQELREVAQTLDNFSSESPKTTVGLLCKR